MFIFYFLGVRLPCCSIFFQFWLCKEAQCVYLRRHLGSPVLSLGPFFFFVLARLLHKQGGALGVHQGGVMLVTALCCCMWGRGREGAMVLALLSAGFQSLSQLPTIKLGPSSADSRVGGLVNAPVPCGSLQ